MNTFQHRQPYQAPGELSKLQHDLECSLDTRELIHVLFENLQGRIGICGLRYDNPALHMHITLGDTASHTCEYQLKQQEQAFGSITTFQKKPLSEIALSRIETMLGLLIMPLQDSLLYQQAMTHSHWDPVTRVNNKTAFKRALNTFRNQRRSSDQKLNAVFLHLNNLRNIYNEFGSNAADAMLCHLIDQLREQCRSEDQIFRFSDDEFVVLLTDTENNEAQLVSQRLSSICQGHQENFHGTHIACDIAVEVVECGSRTMCHGCEHAEKQHCLNQSHTSAMNGAA